MRRQVGAYKRDAGTHELTAAPGRRPDVARSEPRSSGISRFRSTVEMDFCYQINITPEELSLPLCVGSGQVFRWRDAGEGRWLGVDGEHWFLAESIEQGWNVRSNAKEEHFRRLFSLDEDAKNDLLESGPELKPYIEALPGLRLMKPSNAHETLFCFLCTANNHLTRITAMISKLAGYGEIIANVDGEVARRFPSLLRIASLEESELRAQGFGYRARSIPLVARELMQHPPNWLQSLRLRPYEEAREELLRIASIGPKLADCICLYGLHKTEATPIDTHLWQALTREYFPQWKDQALTEKRYREAAEFLRNRFGTLAGLAHLYLYLENLKNWRSRSSRNSKRVALNEF